MEKSQRQVARAAVLVMSAFAVSRVLGLVRQMVFSRYFGTGPEMDAYVAALRIPDAIFLIVAGGALGSAFIPLFTTRLARGQVDDAWRLASSVINVLLVVLAPLSLLCIVIAPWLVRTLVAPALPASLQMETVALMRVMLLSTTVFGVSGIVMGILNAHQHFLLPAIAPILYNLVLIVGVVIGGGTRLGIMGPAIGMVVGALAHLLAQAPGLVRFRARYTPTLGLGDAGVREVGRLMLPRVLGVAAVELNMIITNNLASGLGAGAISALEYAWRLMLLPQGVFAQAVGTAAFPTFSAQVARGELAALRETLSTMLRTIIAITLPSAAGLIVLGSPLIAVMFQHGEFDANSTQSVAWALGFFAVGLVGHSTIEILARAFYALHDTWTPAVAAGVSVVVNVTLGLTLPSVFQGVGVPAHAGLALANSMAALVEMVMLLVIIGRRIGGFHGARIVDQSLRVALASAGMGAVLWCWLWVAPGSVLIQSAVGIALGVGTYVGGAMLLGVNELKWLVKRVLR